MKAPVKYHKILLFLIAMVWLINGLVKVFHLVPRHRMIVARILGDEYAHVFTGAIGIAEIAMAVWIISGIKARLNVIMQIVIITTMNILEFIVVPDLLLWGKLNAVFALLFILLIYYNASARKKFAPQL